MPPFVLHCARRCTQCEANKSAKLKKSCQPKTAKRFFGGPGSQSPSGQAKERTRVLPVRRGPFCPACRAMCRAGRSCAASRCCGGLCARYFCRCAAALFPAFGPLISFCPTRAAGTCPPCALCAQFRLVLAVCLPVLRCLHAHFSLIFRLFLFGCCLSNFFSFVAQAATGISLLVPSRGFVSGLRVLSPAAFSRTFAPVACFSVLCCSRGFSLLFFTFSCLTSSSQTSFHLSLRPRRASTFFRKESRQRFARGRGSAPFEPPFQHPAANLFLSRAAGRLKRPFGPQTAGR